MALTALFTAVLCVAAPFSIMVGPIPISLASLVIYIAAGSLGWKLSALSVVLYIILGAVGLPVFSYFEGGFHKIAGLTGGYIIGYIPCALVTGVAAGIFRWKLRRFVLGMVIGTALLYTCGMVWYMLQSGSSLLVSFALCVSPFLIGDVLKIIIASVITPKLRKSLSVV